MTTTQHDTPHDPTLVTISMQVSKDELLRNVMGSEWDTNGWWRYAVYHNDYDWNTYPSNHDDVYITVGIADPSTYESDEAQKVILRALSLNDIITATAKVLSVSPYMNHYDMDADDGDAIMQVAMLGHITYG
jgi:hypothetical protein